jgi:hypothetical protein
VKANSRVSAPLLTDAASAAGPKMLARPMHSDTTPVKILMTQISLSAILPSIHRPLRNSTAPT